MTYILELAEHRQAREYSCWWTAAAAVLEYHWGYYQEFPWMRNSILAPPVPIPTRTDPLEVWYDRTGQAPATSLFHYAARSDRIAGQIAEAAIRTTGILNPQWWYYRGVRAERHELRLMARLIGFAPISSPIPSSQIRPGRVGNWLVEPFTAARAEQLLRDNGPLVAIRRHGTGHHAIVLFGVTRDARLEGFTVNNTLNIMDPAEGIRSITPSEFQLWIVPGLEGVNILRPVHTRPDPRVRFQA